MARPNDIPQRSACAPSDSGPRWVGDPVDVITGANVFSKRDFAIPGPVKLQWRRNYNHTWADEDRGLGPGFRHALDQWLCFDVDGPTFLGPEGEEVRFPPATADGEAVSAGGFRLLRVTANEYQIERHAQPTRTFRRVAGRQWPLAALTQHGADARIAYDEHGRVDSLWIDEGRALRFEYDDQGHIWRIRLHARNREEPIQLVRYWYDEAGRLVRAQDAYKQVNRFEWDDRNRLIKNVDASGYAFLFEYDAKNRCTASYGEDGLLSVQLTYRPDAFETELLDANGASWLYQWDPAGNLTQIVDPSGGSTQYIYGKQGLETEVDAAGRRTEYVRDAAGAPVAKRLPDGTRVALPKQRGEPEKQPHRVPGCAVEWEYGDLAGDFGLPDAHELRGELPTAIHAALVTSEHPWRGKVERIENEAGLLTREMLEDGRKRRYGYTARGKVRRFRDFDGADYKLETKSWDLPAESTDPLGKTTRFDYSLTAELQEVIDPSGNTISYGYDLKDRLTTITRDTKLHDRYEYDASDNLVAKYDGEGRQLLELEYDGNGRLTRRELIGSDEHHFEYDDHGSLSRARTHFHDVRFGWDLMRRRVRDERNGLGVTHRYAGSELVSTRVLGRFETKYQPLGGGRTVVVDPTGNTHRLRCHGRGVFTRDLANGWSETTQYSPRGWCLAKLTYATDNPDAAWVRRYEYSGEGDLTRVVDTERGVTNHTHDAAHRLVGTVHPDGQQDEYRYTNSGSLLKKPGLEEATVGHINQLRYADRHQFKYGVRQHVEAHRTPNGHELQFRYDARDQLVAVLWNGQPYWSAEYDAVGRRISKTVQGQTWRYWWDGDRLSAEKRPSGQLRVYVYPDAFAIVPMLFVDYDSVDATPDSGRRYYLFTDQRGCPERVVDDAGTTVWEAYIEPYGTAHVRIGREFHQPLRFPGHTWDAELGLHYNRFRYYSPWLGRYLQVDPIGEGGGWNVYGYSSARPLSVVDVRGLADCGPEDQQRREGQDRGDQQRRGPVQIATDAYRRGWDWVFGTPRTEGERQARAMELGPPPPGHEYFAGPNPPGVPRGRQTDPDSDHHHFDPATSRWEEGPPPNRPREHGSSRALSDQLLAQERAQRGDPNYQHPPDHEAHHIISAGVDRRHPMTSEARERGARGSHREPGDARPQTDGVDRPNNGIMLPSEAADQSARDNLPVHRENNEWSHSSYDDAVEGALDRRMHQLLEENGHPDSRSYSDEQLSEALSTVPDDEIEAAITDVESDVRSVIESGGEASGRRTLNDLDSDIDQLYQ